MEETELLTIDEMAALLKVHRSWLYSRTKETGAGSIPRMKIGKYLRFDKKATLAWIRQKYGNE